MSTKELIEKQIEEIGGLLQRLENWTKSLVPHEGAIIPLICVCDRLHQIVQNQQALIETLSVRLDNQQSQIRGLNDRCDYALKFTEDLVAGMCASEGGKSK